MCFVQRCIAVDHTADRRSLLELAYRFLTPLPQRKYRANRRGILLTQNQEKRRAELKKLGVISEVVQSASSYTVYDSYLCMIC
jgi:Developmental protein